MTAIPNGLFGVIARKNGAGGGLASYVGEVERGGETGSATTTAIQPDTEVPAGNHLVLIVSWLSSAQTLDSITDNEGNTWTQDKTVISSAGTDHTQIWSCTVATVLQTADTITLNWGSVGYGSRQWVLLEAENIATSSYVDITASAVSGYSSDTSAVATTLSADTLVVGVTSFSTSQTISSLNWTQIGANQDMSTTRCAYFQGQESATGSKDSQGTLSGNTGWETIWVAYKSA